MRVPATGGPPAGAAQAPVRGPDIYPAPTAALHRAASTDPGATRSRRSAPPLPGVDPVTDAGRRATSIDLQRNQLRDDDADIAGIALRIPAPSAILDRAIARYFGAEPRYAGLASTLGADWSSRLYLRHRTGHGGGSDQPPLVPLTELSWRPRTVGGVPVPPPRPDQFDIIHYDPRAGVTTVSPILNAPEDKQRLLQEFVPLLEAQYVEEERAFWTSRADGMKPARELRRALTSALRTESSLRVQTGTLSLQARRIVQAVVDGDVAGAPGMPGAGRGDAVTADVRRLTWKGAPVPGAFVFTRSPGNDQNGPAVLWRPGRPLQEFDSTHALRGWVAAERTPVVNGRVRADVDDAGTAPVSGNVFRLRLKDVREEMNVRFKNALTDEVGGIPLADHLDNAFDPLPDLGLAPARDGEWTEAARQKAAGEQVPQRVIALEKARQEAKDSAQRLQSLLADVPSLDTYAAQQVQRRFAQQYPGVATLDPDRTLVRYTVVRQTKGVGGVKGTDEVLRSETLSFTDFAKRNADPWVPPLVLGNAHSPIVATTHALADVTPVDRDGTPILDTNGKPIRLEGDQALSFVKALDVSAGHERLLSDLLAPSARTGSARQLRKAWEEATRDRMRAERIETELDPEARAHLTTETRGRPDHPRALDYIDAVIEHPDPSSRPRVDKHEIVASRMTLGATNGNGGGGQTITGVAVIGTAAPKASPGIVLYTPDAPDGLAFRELSDAGRIKDLVRDPAWKTYFTERMSTADPAEAERILSGPGFGAGSLMLTPMTGNFFDEAYREAAGFRIAHANHRSTPSRRVNQLSALNGALEALELGTSLVPVPRVRGARRGIGAGLTPPRAHASSTRPVPARTGDDRVWKAWGIRDPALKSRLVEGNMGPGGLRYQRDPSSGKEYLKIGEGYYRGEYRGGAHVIFNDRNYSESREVFGSNGAVFVRSATGGLRGGVRVPDEVSTHMDALPVFQGASHEFREAYYAKMREYERSEYAVVKILLDMARPGGSQNRLFRDKHERALSTARSATAAAGPSQPPQRAGEPIAGPSRPPQRAAEPAPGPSGSGKRPAAAMAGADAAARPAKKARPGASGSRGGAAQRPARVEITGAELEALSSRPVYRYLQKEKLGRERADNFIEFSTRDLAGTQGKEDRILYFTDITPQQMQENTRRSAEIFGLTALGKERTNKIEAVQYINLRHLPPGTRIYREANHIYTIDRRSSGVKVEMGLQFTHVGENSWIQRFDLRDPRTGRYRDVTGSSAELLPDGARPD